MTVRVFSEIGPLRKVIVHAPGPEVDAMLPERMHQLLFDDIIHGERSRYEHQRFRSVMEAFGVEVVDSRDLLCQTLVARPDTIPGLLEVLEKVEGLSRSVLDRLGNLEPQELAEVLIQGMPHTYLDGQKDPLYRPDPMPIPNLLFSRDACMVLGEQLVVGAMHSPARSREPLLLRHVFAHHPELGTPGLHVDFTMHGHRDGLPYMATPTLEGGDVIVFHEGIVLIGLSERTMESAADRLVDALRGSDRFRAVILVNMPAVRNAMHLDTIFTRASRDECLVYAPMICNDRPETLRATSIDLSDPHDLGRRHASVLDALAHLGVHLKAIPCGGRGSYVQQAREQWTDGANCFALRDGVILLYGRNRGTAAELARHGYQLVDVANLDFDEDGRCLTTFDDTAKYALLLEGHELSRARGGPRCMTMPLLRDPVPTTD